MHFIRSRKLFIEMYPLVYLQNQKMAYFQRQKTQCGTMSILFNIDSPESSYHVLSWFQMSMSTYSSYIGNYAFTFRLSGRLTISLMYVIEFFCTKNSFHTHKNLYKGILRIE